VEKRLAPVKEIRGSIIFIGRAERQIRPGSMVRDQKQILMAPEVKSDVLDLWVKGSHHADPRENGAVARAFLWSSPKQHVSIPPLPAPRTAIPPSAIQSAEVPPIVTQNARTIPNPTQHVLIPASPTLRARVKDPDRRDGSYQAAASLERGARCGSGMASRSPAQGGLRCSTAC
jgi:hypothetical protein